MQPLISDQDLATVDSVEGYLTLDEAALLYTLAADISRDQCIIEVGSYRGRSTVALALGVRAGATAPVYAIDPHETFTGPLGGTFGHDDRAAFFANLLQTGLTAHVRLINLSSEIVAPGRKRPVGLLWIDGDHRYEAVRRDFTVWEPHLVPDGLVAFHDALDETLGPYRVIHELKASGRFIDVTAEGDVRVIATRTRADRRS